MRYDIDSLKKSNELYDYEHHVNSKDVDVANAYMLMIEASRSDIAPKVGDVVIHKDKKMRIDSVEHEYMLDGTATICENAYTPFVSVKAMDSTINVTVSMSGGPFHGVPTKKLTRKGKTSASFCFFGHCGVRAHGAVAIDATVNVWELPANHKL